jgi:anti-anti-sigma factor
VLQVRGSLSGTDGDSGLRRAVRKALDNGARTVVINLREAGPIDSSGVSDLVSSHTEVTSRGGRLKVCHLSQKLKDVLVITRLNTTFDAYETEEEAIASARDVT